MEKPDWDGPTVELPRVAPQPPGVRRLLLAGLGIAVLVLGTLTFASLTSVPAPQAVRIPDATAAAPSPEDRAFDLVSGAAAVSVRTADLGDDLYRAAFEVVEKDGRLTASPGAGPVELVLTDRVRWDLSIGGNADRRRIDLAGGRFRAVSLRDGASHVDLALPRPDGTLTVTLTGGAGRMDVRTAGAEPVRVRVGSGAGQVVLSGRTHSGVAAGALFTPERWDAAGNRIDLDAAAGMSLLTLS